MSRASVPPSGGERHAAPATRVKRWHRFIGRDLWHVDPAELSRTRRTFYHTLQVLALVFERFFNDKVLLLAGALTYSTTLAVVPLLAFIFSFVKGLGVQDRLEPFILERVAAGSQALVSQIVHYLDHVRLGSLGAFGLIILIVSLVWVLSTIENAFNDIWGVTARRTWKRRFADYLSVLVVAPVLLFLALSATATLKSAFVVHWLKAEPGLGPLVVASLRVLPFLATGLALTFLFMFLPNTRVRFKAAAVAGVLTGVVWQATQWLFITFQVGAANTNVLYGAFAQIPIMLVWIYTAWVIVLFGAEFTYAFQNLEAYRTERRSGELTAYRHAELALAVLREIQEAFHAGSEPPTAERLAKRHGAPLRRIRFILEELAAFGLLAVTPLAAGPAFRPARDFSEVEVSEVLEWLETAGGEHGPRHGGEAGARGPLHPERELLLRAWQGRRQALRGRRLDRIDAEPGR